MKKLKQVYNPVSETFLVLMHDDRKGYGVMRQVQGVDDKILRPQWYSDKDRAIDAFEKRLVKEANNRLRLVSMPSLRSLIPLHSLFVKEDELGAAELDPQQQKIYQTENGYFHTYSRLSAVLSDEEANKLVQKIADDYDIKKPCLTISENRTFLTNIFHRNTAAAYRPLFGDIKFYGREHLTPSILCHEMAHVIACHYYPEATKHGPYFAKIATQLYVRYLGMDAERMVGRFNQNGLYGPKTVSVDSVMSPVLPHA